MEHPHSDYWNFFLLAPARQRADRPPQADFRLVWGVCSSLAASPSWAVPQCSQKCPFSVNFAPKWLEILIYAACNYGLCRQQRFGENLETPKPFACIWSSVEVRWQSPGRNQSRCCENTMEAGHLSMFWRTHIHSRTNLNFTVSHSIPNALTGEHPVFSPVHGLLGQIPVLPVKTGLLFPPAYMARSWALSKGWGAGLKLEGWLTMVPENKPWTC